MMGKVNQSKTERMKELIDVLNKAVEKLDKEKKKSPKKVK